MNLKNNKKFLINFRYYIKKILRNIWLIFKKIQETKKNMKQNQTDNLKFKMIFNGKKGILLLYNNERIKKWQNEEDARVKLLYQVYDDRAKALKQKR